MTKTVLYTIIIALIETSAILIPLLLIWKHDKNKNGPSSVFVIGGVFMQYMNYLLLIAIVFSLSMVFYLAIDSGLTGNISLLNGIIFTAITIFDGRIIEKIYQKILTKNNKTDLLKQSDRERLWILALIATALIFGIKIDTSVSLACIVLILGIFFPLVSPNRDEEKEHNNNLFFGMTLEQKTATFFISIAVCISIIYNVLPAANEIPFAIATGISLVLSIIIFFFSNKRRIDGYIRKRKAMKNFKKNTKNKKTSA